MSWPMAGSAAVRTWGKPTGKSMLCKSLTGHISSKVLMVPSGKHTKSY